jgi:hypothetical protein
MPIERPCASTTTSFQTTVNAVTVIAAAARDQATRPAGSLLARISVGGASVGRRVLSSAQRA